MKYLEKYLETVDVNLETVEEARIRSLIEIIIIEIEIAQSH